MTRIGSSEGSEDKIAIELETSKEPNEEPIAQTRRTGRCSNKGGKA